MATTIEREPATAVDTLRTHLQRMVDKCDLEIPVLPTVAARILAMSREATVRSAELAAIVQQDQAIASHVMRVANSAAFGGRARIESLPQALARLGFGILPGILVAHSVSSTVFRVPGYVPVTRDMWRFSLTSALAAQLVAQRLGLNDETTFLCGLLHDIGRPLVLNAAVLEQRRRRLDVSRGQVLELVDSFAARAGALAATKWKLPRPVLESIIVCAHQPSSTAVCDEALHAFLGSRLARLYLNPESVDAAEIRQHEVVARLGLEEADMEFLIEAGGMVLEQVGAFP